MVQNWTSEEFEKAIENYDKLLSEYPDNQDLLEKYQIIQLEYARMKREVGKIG